jgi:purine-nucleoside phosphorylase
LLEFCCEVLVQSAIKFLKSRILEQPKIGIVLGSGLGEFADAVEGAMRIPYADIPNWPVSTAVGHAGMIVSGKIAGVDAAVLSGRCHYYEGYSAEQVVFGVRALGRLGVRNIIFTNAAGGINLSYRQGGLVLISDHINLQGINPLIGPNDETLGPRFPDMSDAYSAELRGIARSTAAELGIQLEEGVYAAMAGPSYETPAEIRFLRVIGADLVGMSTVPEVIVANHMGMRCLAISCVTNMAAGILNQKIQHEEVLETGRRVRDTLIRLLNALVPKLVHG